MRDYTFYPYLVRYGYIFLIEQSNPGDYNSAYRPYSHKALASASITRRSCATGIQKEGRNKIARESCRERYGHEDKYFKFDFHARSCSDNHKEMTNT